MKAKITIEVELINDAHPDYAVWLMVEALRKNEQQEIRNWAILSVEPEDLTV